MPDNWFNDLVDELLRGVETDVDVGYTHDGRVFLVLDGETYLMPPDATRQLGQSLVRNASGAERAGKVGSN